MRPLPGDDGVETVNIGSGGSQSSSLDGRAFERLAHDDRFRDRRDRHPRHDGTRLRIDIDQPAFRKPQKRLADRCAADAEILGDALFLQ